MSQFHYIASPVKLDVGSFGSKKTEVREIEIINPHLIRINSKIEIESYFPIDKNNIEELKKELIVYETEEDAAGIFIIYIGQVSDVSRHFKNRYVYEITPEAGDFIDYSSKNEVSFEQRKINGKCKNVLIEYIRERLKSGEFIELFSSWGGEEALDRNSKLDTIIYIDEIENKKDIEIKDRQYIRFYLSRN